MNYFVKNLICLMGLVILPYTSFAQSTTSTPCDPSSSDYQHCLWNIRYNESLPHTPQTAQSITGYACNKNPESAQPVLLITRYYDYDSPAGQALYRPNLSLLCDYVIRHPAQGEDIVRRFAHNDVTACTESMEIDLVEYKNSGYACQPIQQ